MPTRVLSAVLAACLLAFAASACAGDESGESSDASDAVVRQVDAICDEWREALDQRGDFPVEGFDPEDPSPEDLPAVGDYFAAGHAAAEAAIAKLREHSAPADLEADVEALASAFERELESAREQASAAQAGDVEGFTATLDDAALSQEAVEDAADELGTASCSF